MRHVSIKMGDAYETKEAFKEAFRLWGNENEILSAHINYNPNKVNSLNPKHYPLRIVAKDIEFLIGDVGAGYKGVGSHITFEILRHLHFDVDEQEIFSCPSKTYTMTKTKEEKMKEKIRYGEIAAKWWVNKLNNLNFDFFDNGESTKRSAVLKALAVEKAFKAKVSMDNLYLFEKTLAETIEKELESYSNVSLVSDYGPVDTLAEIADKCGVSRDIFPWKKHMQISHDEIIVWSIHNQKEIIFKA